MKKLLLALVFIAVSVTAYTQDYNRTFAKYAKRQDSLVHDAYYKKDAKAASGYFADLQAEYNKLNVGDQADFKKMVSSVAYNVACAYAIAGDKKNAIDYLEKSKFYDYDHLMSDDDLNSLRKDPRFVKYMAVAKANDPGHLNVLRHAPKYNTAEVSTLPKFTYQSAHDPNLVALKKAYNLDSIAGQGTDVSRMINLTRWVHNSVRHDGSKGNPNVKNAMSFLTVCKADNKTLNCRGLATILNEVFLAEGISSRLVTCLPKDSTDQDCHVITVAYSEMLRKWVWMDPTFMSYMMNEQGELLSIEEVRDRLINGKQINMNPDADHNHENSQSKEDYLEDYMAKNLYKLQCPVNSTYDYETYAPGKSISYITLMPGGYVPAPKLMKDDKGNLVRGNYFTANPILFWSAPPGQSAADFEAAMEQFKKYYNLHESDKLQDMYSDVWGDSKKKMWPETQMTSLSNEYGRLISYKFMGFEPEDGVALFKTTYEKSTHMMGISLDNEGKIETFRFKTSSPYINKLLVKN